MRKMTLYLPADLETALQRVAAETGQSEAAINLEGIQFAISQHTPPSPTIPISVSNDPNFAECADEHLAGFGER